MNDYAIALFLHVVGALGFFVALGLEWVSVRQLRHAVMVQQVHQSVRSTDGARRVGMLSMMTLLASGFYMTITVWGGIPWVLVSLVSLVLLSGVAVAVSGRRMAAVDRAAKGETGSVAPSLQSLLQHPLLWMGIQTRVAIALGIVFLMTIKPPLTESLIAIGVSAVLGIVSALPLTGQQRSQEKPVA